MKKIEPKRNVSYVGATSSRPHFEEMSKKHCKINVKIMKK